MRELDNDFWLLKLFQRHIFCGGRQSRLRACHSAFLDHIAQALFGGLRSRLLWVGAAGEIWKRSSARECSGSQEPREIYSLLEMQRGYYISNRKDLPCCAWGLLEL